MHCPFCRHPDSRVVDSRTTDDGTSPAELVGLLSTDLGHPHVLPIGDPAEIGWARFPTPETADTLAMAGMSCAREISRR